MMVRVHNLWLSELSNVGQDSYADVSALSQCHISMLELPRWPSRELHVTILDDFNVS